MSTSGIFIGYGSNLNLRPNKGKSIIAFPTDYVSVDIETTGLDSAFDKILEIAAIRYVNGQKAEKFSSLVNPHQKICAFITQLTGITNEMVEHAPEIEDVITKFHDFIGDDLLLAYNIASFDSNFLYDKMRDYTDYELTNNFIDVLRIARKVHPELEHHRQADMATFYKIDNYGAHRAEFDCEVCNEIFQRLKQEIPNQQEFIDGFNKKRLRTTDVKDVEFAIDEESPLYGKECVFTGKLEKMEREEAWKKVLAVGGKIADNVTKKTSFLILGNNDYRKSLIDGKSNKQKTAEKLILKGKDLQILSEDAFYSLIENK